MNKSIKIMFSVVVLAMSAGAQANRSNVGICNDLQDLGYKIMELRQSGVPVSQVMSASDGNQVVNAIIISAYEEMRYSTREFQVRASRDFADKIYLECFKTVSKK